MNRAPESAGAWFGGDQLSPQDWDYQVPEQRKVGVVDDASGRHVRIAAVFELLVADADQLGRLPLTFSVLTLGVYIFCIWAPLIWPIYRMRDFVRARKAAQAANIVVILAHHSHLQTSLC